MYHLKAMHLRSSSACACASSSCARLCSRGSALHHRVAAVRVGPLSARCLHGTDQHCVHTQTVRIFLLSRGPAATLSELDRTQQGALQDVVLWGHKCCFFASVEQGKLLACDAVVVGATPRVPLLQHTTRHTHIVDCITRLEGHGLQAESIIDKEGSRGNSDS